MADPRFPEFYIVGAAKAGTTSLVALLQDVPGIFFPIEKEPHHFFLREDRRAWTIRDGRRVRPLRQALPYGDEAGYLALYAHAASGAMRGDASTQYLVNETVPQAISAVREDARILVILRDPVERAYSAWLHAAARGEDDASFATALDECESGARATSFAINYIDEGRYDLHLARYRAVFGARVEVLLFEELVADPAGAKARICAFLNLPDSIAQGSVLGHRNASVSMGHPAARIFRLAAKRLRRLSPRVFEQHLVRKAYEAVLGMISQPPAPMPDDQRRRLAALYAPHNRALARMLGRDLSHWGQEKRRKRD